MTKVFFAAGAVKMLRNTYCVEWGVNYGQLFLPYQLKKQGGVMLSLIDFIAIRVLEIMSPLPRLSSSLGLPGQKGSWLVMPRPP